MNWKILLVLLLLSCKSNQVGSNQKVIASHKGEDGNEVAVYAPLYRNPESGKTVRLIDMVHIGLPDYYKGVQKAILEDKEDYQNLLLLQEALVCPKGAYYWGVNPDQSVREKLIEYSLHFGQSQSQSSIRGFSRSISLINSNSDEEEGLIEALSFFENKYFSVHFKNLSSLELPYFIKKECSESFVRDLKLDYVLDVGKLGLELQNQYIHKEFFSANKIDHLLADYPFYDYGAEEAALESAKFMFVMHFTYEALAVSESKRSPEITHFLDFPYALDAAFIQRNDLVMERRNLWLMKILDQQMENYDHFVIPWGSKHFLLSPENSTPISHELTKRGFEEVLGEFKVITIIKCQDPESTERLELLGGRRFGGYCDEEAFSPKL